LKRFTSFCTLILIVSGWLMATAQANKPEPTGLDTRIKQDVLIENPRSKYLLSGLLQGTGLQGGFAEVAGCSEDQLKGRVQLKQGTTVRQALDALVAANPGYRWELRDGVVNLMPRSGVPLLRTRIAKFQIDTTDRDIAALLHNVLSLPEVREREAELGLKEGTYAGPGGGGAAVEKHPRTAAACAHPHRPAESFGPGCLQQDRASISQGGLDISGDRLQWS
jgi:hypothetical protein